MACKVHVQWVLEKMHKLVGWKMRYSVVDNNHTRNSHGIITSAGHRHIFVTRFLRFVWTYYGLLRKRSPIQMYIIMSFDQANGRIRL